MSEQNPQQPPPGSAPAVSFPSDPAPGSSAAQGGPPSGRKRTSVLGAWGARVVLIVVGACALVSVVFILFGTGGDTLARVITTDVALILFALLVWLDTVIGAYRPEWFEFASLATDAYLLLLWIVTVWTASDTSSYFQNLSLAMGIWLGLLCLLFVRAMLALVDLVRFLAGRWEGPVTRALGFIAGICFAVIGVMVTLPTPKPFNDFWDWDYYGRIVASLAVIGGVALVLIPLWGLLINRGHRAARQAPYGYRGNAYAATGYGTPGYGATGYDTAYGAAYAGNGSPTTGYPAGPVDGRSNPGVAPDQGAVQRGSASAAGAVPAPVPPAAPSVQSSPAGPLSTGPSPAAPAPAGPSSTAPSSAAAGHPPLAWPRLADGRPLPVGPDGAPDYGAVNGLALAWPTFVDGSPVPAAPDGRPLYH